MWEYTDKVREHFLNPKNAGEIENPSAVGEVGSLACGDALKLYLDIDENGVIQDARFQTFGCASAIASSSVLTEMLKGKTVEEAEKISNKEIAEQLGGLPKEKMHCSVMGQEALEAAIKSFRGEPVEIHEHPVGELVCKCFGITDEQVRRAVKENDLKTVEEITNFTKAGGGCGDCLPDLARILNEVQAEAKGEAAAEAEKPKKKLSNIQRMQLVTKVIDEEIRPGLKMDGGDIELIDIEGTVVKVSLRGSCVNCPSSALTLKHFVEQRLRDMVEPDITVEQV